MSDATGTLDDVPASLWRPRSERGHLELTPRTYGHSARGIPLEVYLPPSGASPRRLVFAGIHGHEPDTTAVLSAALRSIVGDALTCAVVLAANPDGLLRGIRGNANGVELNRNWPSSTWQPDPVPHRWLEADVQDVWLSPGPEPGSEPEVRHLIELIDDLGIDDVVSVHSPLGCVDDPRNLPVGGWLAAETGLPRVATVGYPTPGSFGTWTRERDLPCVTHELPVLGISNLIARQGPVFARLVAGYAP